jgi:hypothetical protein
MNPSSSLPQFIPLSSACYPLPPSPETTASQDSPETQHPFKFSSERIPEFRFTPPLSPLSGSFSVDHSIPGYHPEPITFPLLPPNTLPAKPDPQGKPINRHPELYLYRSRSEARSLNRQIVYQQHQELAIKRRNRGVSITSASSSLTYGTTPSSSAAASPIESFYRSPTYQIESYDSTLPGFQGNFIPEFKVLSPTQFTCSHPTYTVLPQYRFNKPKDSLSKRNPSKLSINIMESPDGLLADYGASSPTESKQSSGGFLRKLKWRFRRSLSPVNGTPTSETVTAGLGIQNAERSSEETEQKSEETEERTGSSGGIGAFNPFKKSKRRRDTQQEEVEYEDIYDEPMDHWASGDW